MGGAAIGGKALYADIRRGVGKGVAMSTAYDDEVIIRPIDWTGAENVRNTGVILNVLFDRKKDGTFDPTRLLFRVTNTGPQDVEIAGMYGPPRVLADIAGRDEPRLLVAFSVFASTNDPFRFQQGAVYREIGSRCPALLKSGQQVERVVNLLAHAEPIRSGLAGPARRRGTHV